MNPKDPYLARLLLEHSYLRRAAIGLLAILAIISTTATVALFLSGINDRRALRDAKRALASAVVLEHRLAKQADGQCFHVEYFRWNYDKQIYAAYLRDVASAEFLGRLGSNHALPVSNGLLVLSRIYRLATSAEFFLPLTDCRNAQRNPFAQPKAIPFVHASKAALQEALTKPPVPLRDQ